MDLMYWSGQIKKRFNVLVGADKEKIINAYSKKHLLFSDNFNIDLYGNGKASESIIRGIISRDQ